MAKTRQEICLILVNSTLLFPSWSSDRIPLIWTYRVRENGMSRVLHKEQIELI